MSNFCFLIHDLTFAEKCIHTVAQGGHFSR